MVEPILSNPSWDGHSFRQASAYPAKSETDLKMPERCVRSWGCWGRPKFATHKASFSQGECLKSRLCSSPAFGVWCAHLLKKATLIGPCSTCKYGQANLDSAEVDQSTKKQPLLICQEFRQLGFSPPATSMEVHGLPKERSLPNGSVHFHAYFWGSSGKTASGDV